MLSELWSQQAASLSAGQKPSTMLGPKILAVVEQMRTSKLLEDNLTKCRELTCDGLVSHPKGVQIFPVAPH